MNKKGTKKRTPTYYYIYIMQHYTNNIITTENNKFEDCVDQVLSRKLRIVYLDAVEGICLLGVREGPFAVSSLVTNIQ